MYRNFQLDKIQLQDFFRKKILKLQTWVGNRWLRAELNVTDKGLTGKSGT
jgi:hypothetical protein